jgi:Uncharacterized conserved protein
MTRFALYVELKAQTGKEEDVAAFLTSAQGLVAAEPGTVAWFAVRKNLDTFLIFDAFDDEAGRDAHLNGQVAEALIAQAPSLFAAPLQIHSAQVLASKLPA